jgi:hypothetical protein
MTREVRNQMDRIYHGCSPPLPESVFRHDIERDSDGIWFMTVYGDDWDAGAETVEVMYCPYCGASLHEMAL